MARAVLAQRSEVLDALFRDYDGPPFAVRFWDDWTWRSGEQSPACTMVLRSPAALQSMVVRPNEVSLGEAFITKEIDVEGDIFAVFGVAEHLFHRPGAQRERAIQLLKALYWTVDEWWNAAPSHSPESDRAAISFHYDQPIEFFRPWLGRTLAYSCAYFRAETDSLDTAQQNKLDLICRKLRLKPLERFLDVGCGWGSLVMHAASRYGVSAQGITLSQEQQKVAQQRIAAAELTQSCDVKLQDYRDLAHGSIFDKIASVGMFEHVGLRNLPDYFRIVYNLLAPGGVFLNHGIARTWSAHGEDGPPAGSTLAPWNALHLRKPRELSFIDKYVFPHGELVTLSDAVRAAEQAGFEVRDVENLREHYELTLRHWTTSLRRHAQELMQCVSEKTYRNGSCIWPARQRPFSVAISGCTRCSSAVRRMDAAIFLSPGKTGTHRRFRGSVGAFIQRFGPIRRQDREAMPLSPQWRVRPRSRQRGLDRSPRLALRTIAFYAHAAQDPGQHRNADACNQKDDPAGKPPGQVRIEEHGYACVDEDGEDAAQRATRHNGLRRSKGSPAFAGLQSIPWTRRLGRWIFPAS